MVLNLLWRSLSVLHLSHLRGLSMSRPFHSSLRWLSPLMALTLSVGCGEDPDQSDIVPKAGAEAGEAAGENAGEAAGEAAGVRHNRH